MVLYMFSYMSIESSRIIIIPIEGGAGARTLHSPNGAGGLSGSARLCDCVCFIYVCVYVLGMGTVLYGFVHVFVYMLCMLLCALVPAFVDLYCFVYVFVDVSVKVYAFEYLFYTYIFSLLCADGALCN